MCQQLMVSIGVLVNDPIQFTGSVLHRQKRGVLLQKTKSKSILTCSVVCPWETGCPFPRAGSRSGECCAHEMLFEMGSYYYCRNDPEEMAVWVT